MNRFKIVGAMLMIGSVVDFALCEYPRLADPDSYNATAPWFGLTQAQSGYVGTAFDAVIFYGGYLLFRK
jgi:hypothetical protein